MNHWAGISWRLEPSAFKALDVWGQIPGGAIANWPITYEDLEPYFTKYEYRFGVSGDAEQMPHSPPRSRPYPLPPIEQTHATLHFAEASRSLGYQPFRCLQQSSLGTMTEGNVPVIAVSAKALNVQWMPKPVQGSPNSKQQGGIRISLY
jgi:choline dehydrogenase-like flavoprotein